MMDGVLKFITKDFTGDSIEFCLRDGKLWIEIDSPWAGDSISGFGQNLSEGLEPDQVKELIVFLTREDQ